MEYLWLTFDPGGGDLRCCPPSWASQPSLSLLWLETGVSRMGRGRWQDSSAESLPSEVSGVWGKWKWEEEVGGGETEGEREVAAGM